MVTSSPVDAIIDQAAEVIAGSRAVVARTSDAIDHAAVAIKSVAATIERVNRTLQLTDSPTTTRQWHRDSRLTAEGLGRRRPR